MIIKYPTHTCYQIYAIYEFEVFLALMTISYLIRRVYRLEIVIIMDLQVKIYHLRSDCQLSYVKWTYLIVDLVYI